MSWCSDQAPPEVHRYCEEVFGDLLSLHARRQDKTRQRHYFYEIFLLWSCHSNLLGHRLLASNSLCFFFWFVLWSMVDKRDERWRCLWPTNTALEEGAPCSMTDTTKISQSHHQHQHRLLRWMQSARHCEPAHPLMVVGVADGTRTWCCTVLWDSQVVLMGGADPLHAMYVDSITVLCCVVVL